VSIDLRSKVRDVADFPKPGIDFKDIMPLLRDPDALREAIDAVAAWAAPRRPEIVVGAEARGFFVGAALAHALGCGFVPARREGKLPLETTPVEYELEYGTSVLEVQTDAIREGTRVLIHDDVLATGGTAKAMTSLVDRLGGEVVGYAFLIELGFLNGRQGLAEDDVFSLIRY
jgi:adenine phosphoribosyltransferase